MRERRNKGSKRKPPVSIDEARANHLRIDWDDTQISTPNTAGLQVLENYPLEKLVDTIDWTPFFSTWELAGKYPKILDDEVVGAQARELFTIAPQIFRASHKRS